MTFGAVFTRQTIYSFMTEIMPQTTSATFLLGKLVIQFTNKKHLFLRTLPDEDHSLENRVFETA